MAQTHRQTERHNWIRRFCALIWEIFLWIRIETNSWNVSPNAWDWLTVMGKNSTHESIHRIESLFWPKIIIKYDWLRAMKISIRSPILRINEWINSYLSPIREMGTPWAYAMKIDEISFRLNGMSCIAAPCNHNNVQPLVTESLPPKVIKWLASCDDGIPSNIHLHMRIAPCQRTCTHYNLRKLWGGAVAAVGKMKWKMYSWTSLIRCIYTYNFQIENKFIFSLSLARSLSILHTACCR